VTNYTSVHRNVSPNTRSSDPNNVTVGETKALRRTMELEEQHWNFV